MLQSPIDSLTRDQIRQLQLERLQMTLNRAYFNVDFYRRRMDNLNFLPEDLGTFADLQRFPFTTRQDLADNYPYGFFAVPLRNIVRLKVTSPALHARGKPIVIGFTRHDVAMWQSLVGRLYRQLEITDRDIVQVAFNYSLFSGAFTFNHATENLGATLAPSATLSATRQLQIMLDFRSTVLATTAAFALHIVDTMERHGPDPGNLSLRLVLLGPEPLSETTRRRLESVFTIPVYGLYGVTEMVEPGMAGECPAKTGLHFAEDQFLAEIVHPTSGEPVAPEQEGELVITTLTTEAYPLVRYRTGDITVVHQSPCPCGRTSARISPILRRTDDRVSVRGIPFHAEQLEGLLRAFDQRIEDLRFIIQTCFGVGDQLEILISRPNDQALPGGSRSQYLELLRSHLRRSLGLGARIQLTESQRLPKEGLISKTIFRNTPLALEKE